MYARNARDVAASVKAVFPSLEVAGVGSKGRRNAFEISFEKAGSSGGQLIWSGLSKGPPRKLKFPEASIVIDEVKKLL